MYGTVALEVCVDSLESVEKVIDIVQQGKNRFEVCSNLIHGGGLTPSIGLVNSILHRYPGTRVMAMIRPRIGSFVYSDSELEVMVQDIMAFKAAGVMGVVFGCLTKDGTVDTDACRRLATAAKPLAVTFHRAIDVTSYAEADWILDGTECNLIAIATIEGITRILTSGKEPNVSEGFGTLLRYSKWATEFKRRVGRSITILPGSGMDPAIVAQMIDSPSWAKRIEVHMTGSSVVEDEAVEAGYNGPRFGFGANEKWVLDRSKIEDVWTMLISKE